MPQISTDHKSQGRKHLKLGLDFIKKNDIEDAVEEFFKAAVSFERAQDFRQIPALWEAIGDLLDNNFIEKNPEFLKELNKGHIDSIYRKKYQWPLHYKTISWNSWNIMKDQEYKQSWAYEWAAKHLERANSTRTAYKLYLKAAYKAENSEYTIRNNKWERVARFYLRAIITYIRSYGTIDKTDIKKAIKRMNLNYFKLKKNNPSNTYRSLVIAYRSIKSQLIEAANLTEADKFRRSEQTALIRYYLHKKRYFKALGEWLSGKGFIYSIIIFFLLIILIFPLIYLYFDLVAAESGQVGYLDTLFYSLESTMGISHLNLRAIGIGKWLNIIETSLSWLGLGIFLWWITRRLE